MLPYRLGNRGALERQGRKPGRQGFDLHAGLDLVPAAGEDQAAPGGHPPAQFRPADLPEEADGGRGGRPAVGEQFAVADDVQGFVVRPLAEQFQDALLGREAPGDEPAAGVVARCFVGPRCVDEIGYEHQARGRHAGLSVRPLAQSGVHDEPVRTAHQRVPREAVPSGPGQRKRRGPGVAVAAVPQGRPGVAVRTPCAHGACAIESRRSTHGPVVVQGRHERAVPVPNPGTPEVRKQIVHVHHVGGVRAQPRERAVAPAGRHARRCPQRVERILRQFVGAGGEEFHRVARRAQRAHLVQYERVFPAGLCGGVEAVYYRDLHDRAPSVVVSRSRHAPRARAKFAQPVVRAPALGKALCQAHPSGGARIAIWPDPGSYRRAPAHAAYRVRLPRGRASPADPPRARRTHSIASAACRTPSDALALTVTFVGFIPWPGARTPK